MNGQPAETSRNDQPPAKSITKQPVTPKPPPAPAPAIAAPPQRAGTPAHEIEAAIEKLKPLLAAMGKLFFRMGDTGKGQAAKLAMNLQIALIYEGFAEALTLATKLGVSAETLIPLVQASMVRSGVVEYKAPFVLKRDFSPNFPLRLMHKDIHLAL